MKIACEPLAPESDDYSYILQSTKLTFDESATTMNKAVHCVSTTVLEQSVAMGC